MFTNIGQPYKQKIVAGLLGFATFLTLFLFLVLPAPVQAQGLTGLIDVWSDPFSEAGVTFNAVANVGFGRKDPRVIVAGVVEVAIGFLGVLAILLMIYGGVVWMTAGGAPAKIETAKKILKNGVIGLLIVLSAFAVALFVMRVLIGVTGGIGGTLKGNMAGGGGSNGLGALGSGIVRSVYPTPNQLAVPRNTAIIVTFKEAVDPATICDKLVGGKCAPDAKIIPGNVIIEASLAKTLGQGQLAADTPAAAPVINALVKTVDNLTYVFVPVEYLGNPDGNSWYSVSLSTKLKKAGGKEAFALGGFTWRFEVSNKLDLEPPKIITAELFPPADNTQDTVGSVVPAERASALLTVVDQPRAKTINRLSYLKTTPGSVNIDVPDPIANQCDGQINVAINNSAPLSASINYNGIAGKADDATAAIIDRKIKTSCGFTIQLDPGLAAGMSWSISAVAGRDADSFTLAGHRYSFTAEAPGAGEVAIGANEQQTAANIAQALAGDLSATAQVNGNKIKLTARQAGSAGNNLNLSVSSASLIADPFIGGFDQKTLMKVQDLVDQPKNATIQINFNEAIDPTAISGLSESVKDAIRVVDVATNARVEGQFTVSNEYRTVEFTPSSQCATNGCGEPVYCLPKNTQLRVELVAATLSATCSATSDCAARAPYNDCQGGLCVRSSDGAKYPSGTPGSGVADLAFNSLDGNDDNQAQGPVSFYDLNKANPKQGDNFAWSFWISDVLDITPPTIVRIEPDNGTKGVSLNLPVTLEFSKLMSASTLTSGSRIVTTDSKEVRHQLINLRSLDNNAVGYWVEKSEIDTDTPADGRPNHTIALIEHPPFADSIIYRAQAGSGIKDIYQNCFKPCAGTGCQPVADNSSCCKGLPGKTNADGNCP
ncbi:MAG: Ig-like domain-containing protein [Candidatus Falkowbacteria bacterium]